MCGGTSARKGSIGLARRYSALAAIAVGFLLAGEALAQSERVASFVSASQITADPYGNLYVIDRGAGLLVRIGADGRRESVGGRGGAIAMPTAVDPTNGLRIYVADGSTGEIYRFTRTLALIDVHTAERSPDHHGRSTADNRRTTRAPADIVAIGSTRVGNVVILDRRERRIDLYDMRWRHLGEVAVFGPESRPFEDPSGLCIGQDDRMFVLDSGNNSLLIFDAFGSFIGEERLPVRNVHAMSCDRNSVQVHSANSAFTWFPGGWQAIVLPDDIESAVIGSIAVEGTMYWLTERALYRTNTIAISDGP
jgi:hypothetical protein